MPRMVDIEVLESGPLQTACLFLVHLRLGGSIRSGLHLVAERSSSRTRRGAIAMEYTSNEFLAGDDELT